MLTTAAIFDRLGTIVFGPSVPTDLLDAIRRLGGRVVEGVTLDDPREGGSPPNGAEIGRPTVYVSETDPRDYRVFSHPSRVPKGFRPAARQFTVLAAASWASFVRNLAEMNRIAGHTDASDTVEIWAEVDRTLAGRAG